MKHVAIIILIVAAGLIGWQLMADRQDRRDSEPEGAGNGEVAGALELAGKAVVFETSRGVMKIELYPDIAPKTAANFAQLAQEGFYNNLTFHRVISGFVIQGGDPLGSGAGGPGYTLPAEISLTHKRGSVAMARLGDPVNPERASSGSQFYIALQDLPDLDGQYTVFGQVVEGLAVVDAIAAVATDDLDRPVEQVVIIKAYLE